MKTFNHINATTLAEATAALAAGKATLIAGGTDLLGRLKDDILPDYPSTLVNLKTIPGLNYIKEEGGVLKLGAGTHLAELAGNKIVQAKYNALAQAAGRAASPHIREMGTLGGNLCQLHRCWYFRNPDNRFECARKGGNLCFAMTGDNRYHSIFGAVNGCIAVHPSDTAPALIALDARVVTTKRTIPIQDFWKIQGPSSTVLDADEIVTEIQLPSADTKSAFSKFAIRKSIDFAIVNCAVALNGDQARICLNGVAPTPFRAVDAEAVVAGKKIDEALAEAAGKAAVAGAKPFAATKYKVQIAKTLVKRTLLELASVT